MSETKAPKLDSEVLFKRLVEKLRGKTDYQQRVVAHIRTKHGHATLPTFHSNGVPEAEKFKTYGECMTAIIRAERGEPNPWSILHGQVPNGQAAPVEDTPAESAPTTRDALAEPKRVEAPEPQPTNRLVEAQKAMMTPTASVAAPAPAGAGDILTNLAHSLAPIIATLINVPTSIDEITVKRIIDETLATYSPELDEDEVQQLIRHSTKELEERFGQTLAQYRPAMDPKQLADAVQVALQSSVGQAVSKGLKDGELRALPSLIAVDPHYVRTQTGEEIAESFAEETPLMVSGPSGSGKTFPIEQELRLAERRYLPPISVADGLTRQDLIIRQAIQQNAKATGVETIWRYGVLPFCMMNGLAIILDEFDQLQPELAAVIYYVSEYRKLVIPETGETAEAMPGFQIFATCNGLRDTTGLYSGFRLSNALTNRFDFVKADYLAEVDENAIFRKYGVDITTAAKLTEFLNRCRKQYEAGKLTFAPSTRVGCRVAKKVAQGIGIRVALNRCMMHALVPAEAKLVSDLATSLVL